MNLLNVQDCISGLSIWKTHTFRSWCCVSGMFKVWALGRIIGAALSFTCSVSTVSLVSVFWKTSGFWPLFTAAGGSQMLVIQGLHVMVFRRMCGLNKWRGSGLTGELILKTPLSSQDFCLLWRILEGFQSLMRPVFIQLASVSLDLSDSSRELEKDDVWKPKLWIAEGWLATTEGVCVSFLSIHSLDDNVESLRITSRKQLWDVAVWSAFFIYTWWPNQHPLSRLIFFSLAVNK